MTMTRQQQQMLLLGVLSVIMVGVFARACRQSVPPVVAVTSGLPLSNESAQPIASIPHPASADPAARRAQREQGRLLAWTRDPFTGARADGLVSTLTLTGILWDPTNPMAIINGATLQVGEAVGGYQVAGIEQDRVTLTSEAQTVTLTVSP